MSLSCLGIFAKHWTAGAVKTRLAATIGNGPAADFHRACVETTTRRLRGLSDRQILAFSPPAGELAFRSATSDDWSLATQSDGDLGTRMHDFLDRQFAAGAARIVLLGSDSPNLPPQYVRTAFRLLETQRLVLGPTEDGGYYLVGASQQVPPIFSRMPWSTPELWPATLGRLDQAGWRLGGDYQLLPSWYDIDTYADLQRLHQDLQDAPTDDEPLRDLLTATSHAIRHNIETRPSPPENQA